VSTNDAAFDEVGEVAVLIAALSSALEALHAALTERAAPVRNLGADLPIPALRDAVHRTHPFAVVIWAQTDRTARVGQLAQLHSPDSTAVVAVGPGWARRRLPPVFAAPTPSPPQ
jgi:MerR family transcriptional regulator, light-induced transcriptional regulator